MGKISTTEHFNPPHSINVEINDSCYLNNVYFVSKQTCCLSLIQTGCNADASAAADFGLRANRECTHARLPAQAPQGRRGEAAGGGREARSWARPLFIHSWFSSLIHMQIRRVEGGGCGEGWAVVAGRRMTSRRIPSFPSDGRWAARSCSSPLSAARSVKCEQIWAAVSGVVVRRRRGRGCTRSLHVAVALAHPPHPFRLFCPPLSFSLLLWRSYFIQRRCGGRMNWKRRRREIPGPTFTQIQLHRHLLGFWRQCSTVQQKHYSKPSCAGLVGLSHTTFVFWFFFSEQDNWRHQCFHLCAANIDLSHRKGLFKWHLSGLMYTSDTVP